LIPHPRALLIDGTAGLYRAYFALRSLIGRDGAQANAVYGFTRMLLDLLREWRPAYAAAAFDVPGAATFRNTLYADYKSTRAAMPERLASQLEPALAAAHALGVPTFSCCGYEADDILATLVQHLRARAIACLVIAADKDMAQLVAPGVWLCPPGQPSPMDADAVRVRYGVPPERIPDLLALRGDAADNIPGIPGIGGRTALRLLATPGPVRALWDGADRLEGLGLSNPKAVTEALQQGKESFHRNRDLATLRNDVPLELTVEALIYRGVDTAAVQAMGERHGFDRLRERILEFAAEWDRQRPSDPEPAHPVETQDEHET
jgi:DNA polymerase-1